MCTEALIRENIKELQPYSAARHEFSGKASVFLDANENPFNSNYNRYPDPFQTILKEKIASLKKVPSKNIFLGNGSDEAIDLLIRIFCEPGQDKIIICPPTYGMYEVCARVNDIKVIKVDLLENYQLDIYQLLNDIDPTAKIIFLCSPNNPTGNTISRTSIEYILNEFNGIVVIDEAYIEFSDQLSFTTDLADYDNLVILQTFSKAWGMAGLRLGLAFSSALIVSYMNKIKYPYNINTMTQQLVLQGLQDNSLVEEHVRIIIEQRDWLAKELEKFAFVSKVFPSEANFLWISCDEPLRVYEYLKVNGIVVRYKDNLRISIGTPDENKLLIETLRRYEKDSIR